MPEAAEIALLRDQIEAECINLYITNIVYGDLFVKNKQYFNAKFIAKKLPLQLVQVFSRAKRLLLIVVDFYNLDYAIAFFMAMTGQIYLQPTKYTQISFEFSKKTEDGFEVVKSLHYQDHRPLGFAKFLSTGDEVLDIFKAIGPEVLTGELTLDMFRVVINNKRLKNKEVAALLLDQKHFSGIGMYLTCDILYRSKMSPYRKICDIEEEEVEVLYNAMRSITQKAYEKMGLTIGDFRNLYKQEGQYKPLIYGRKDRPNYVHEKFGPEPKGKDSRRSIHYDSVRQT